MINIDKRALREAAEKAKHSSEWDIQRIFIEALEPDDVLALLDELEAKDRRNAELNSRLERWAVDRAQSASELDDAEKRIAELSHHLQSAHALSSTLKRLATKLQAGFCAVVMRSGTLMSLNRLWPQPVKERHHEHYYQRTRYWYRQR